MANQQSLQPLLRAADVSCGYKKKIVVERVNIDLYPGRVVGLIGANGVGKSTLIRTLIGDILPYKGMISYSGVSVHKLKQRSNVFGVVTETQGLPLAIRVASIVKYWSSIHNISAQDVASISECLGVNTFTGKRIRQLSTGMRRRLEILLALLPNPKVLIFDEPFNGLDLDGVKTVRQLIDGLRNQGKAVLLSTHTLDEIDRLADTLFAVNNAHLCEVSFAKGKLGASEAAYMSMTHSKREMR